MSFPYDRDIDTINPRPSLASHAPNVSKITAMAVFGAPQFINISGTNSTSLRVIPSNDRRVIKKCVWLNNILVVAKIGNKHIIVKAVLFIELRGISLSSTYKVVAYNVSFQFSDSAVSDHWHPRSVFFINYYLCVIWIYIFSMKS